MHVLNVQYSGLWNLYFKYIHNWTWPCQRGGFCRRPLKANVSRNKGPWNCLEMKHGWKIFPALTSIFFILFAIDDFLTITLNIKSYLLLLSFFYERISFFCPPIDNFKKPYSALFMNHLWCVQLFVPAAMSFKASEVCICLEWKRPSTARFTGQKCFNVLKHVPESPSHPFNNSAESAEKERLMACIGKSCSQAVLRKFECSILLANVVVFEIYPICLVGWHNLWACKWGMWCILWLSF